MSVLDKAKYRTFCQEYDMYARKGGDLSMASCISENILAVVAARAGYAVADILVATNEQVKDCSGSDIPLAKFFSVCICR